MVGTFDALEVGTRFESPPRTLTEHDGRALIGLGGYTHPLFTDPAFAASSTFGRTPLPGEAVLLVMGGLVEQSGRFDDTVIALTGFDQVRFKSPAFGKDEVRVVIEVLDKERAPAKPRGTLVMRWTCVRGSDVLCEAIARMLFRLEPEAR